MDMFWTFVLISISGGVCLALDVMGPIRHRVAYWSIGVFTGILVGLIGKI